VEHTRDHFLMEAEIQLIEETEELQREVASVVKFPENKTPDMLFFSGIFVSSGANLNKAYFLPSELVKAFATINNKALDIEHDETSIIGHIYSSAFVDREGNKVDINSLKDLSESELNSKDLDIMIGGIIYKSRFPELAEEIKKNKWKLSMETYFSDFDIKIGDLIMSRKDAEALGIASDKFIGRMAKVLRKGREIAKGEIARVLRGLLFSGCGIVKHPANPRSLILETAKKTGDDKDIISDAVIVEMEDLTEETAQEFNSPAADPGGVTTTDVESQTSVGLCVSYKKRVIDATYEGPDVKVLHEDWCTLYDRECTSPSRGADHPDCLRNKISSATKACIKDRLSLFEKKDKRGDLLAQLKSLLNN